MTIDKAIEILQHRKKPGDYIEPVEEEDLDKAILLGIEALRKVRDFRLGNDPKSYWRLPGETEE